jgi:hypothetical protein
VTVAAAREAGRGSRAESPELSESAIQVSRDEVDRRPSRESAATMLGSMPTVFVENAGQWDEGIRFGARRNGMRATFTDRGMTVSLLADRTGNAETWQSFALHFRADDGPVAPSGECELRGRHNYFLGNDPTKWRTCVTLYEAVRYDDVAPGIDVLVQERDGLVAYDLHVEPGADLAAFEVHCEGIDSIELEPDGALSLHTASGTVRQTPPRSWYEDLSGEPKLADCRFKVTGPSTYGFEVLDPDPSSRLIVDPGLTWSTFLGGSDFDRVYGVDFDSGLVTVAGETCRR